MFEIWCSQGRARFVLHEVLHNKDREMARFPKRRVSSQNNELRSTFATVFRAVRPWGRASSNDAMMS